MVVSRESLNIERGTDREKRKKGKEESLGSDRIRNLRYGKLQVSDTSVKQVLKDERNFRTSEPRKVETREESLEEIWKGNGF